MIKTIGLLTRKDDWTHEQFMKHWVEIHAPLAHAVPGLRRYVQNHIKGERTRADVPATEVAIDGIAELWFEDQAALEAAAKTPEMKALHADGAKFIGRIRSYVIDEKTVIG
ncbi:MAG: EthD family reductase [Reyranella sp.]|nr:EthD family reductase [Reyranella sp.]